MSRLISRRRRMRLSRNAKYWLAVAACVVLYALYWKFKLPAGRRGSGINFIANLSMLWVITATFLAVATSWNGPRPLRRCTDEIRILPRYRALIAEALYPAGFTQGLQDFFIFSAACILFLDPLCLIHYLIWGTAAFHALIGLDIEARLDISTYRRRVVQEFIWAGIPVWIPILLYIARDVCDLLRRSHIQVLEQWSNLLYAAVVVIAIYLPAHGAIRIYRRALGELDKLNYTAPFWPQRDEV